MKGVEFILFSVAMVSLFLAMILYVLFGQITVRRLRRNEATKKALGFEFVSGWDIINVAEAFAIPKSWSRKFENGPLSGLYAKSEILREYTSPFDRFLGALLFWLLVLSVIIFISLAVLNKLGFWD